MDVEKGVKKKKMNRFESVKLCHLFITKKERRSSLPVTLKYLEQSHMLKLDEYELFRKEKV